MYTAVDETIVAVSSAPGRGERGIVRLSGADALRLADTLFQGAALAASPGFRIHDGAMIFEGPVTAPARAMVFRAPHSYTRQDLVELHTIGVPALLDMIVEHCLQSGARLADPGEFTARAYLAGAMSLPEAESVAATIHARTDAQLRAARHLLRGDLARAAGQWQEQLAELLALVVADIDFAEEPIEFLRAEELVERVRAIEDGLDQLLAEALPLQRLDVLPRIVLLGPPNAGKSTLLNALSGMSRAIISAVSGTTRDVLSAPVRLASREAVLLDAAGLDDDPDAVLVASRRLLSVVLEEVDLVCVVWQATVAVEAADAPVRLADLAALCGAPQVVAISKCDMADAGQVRATVAAAAALGIGPVVSVSARTGDGLADLRTALEEALHAGPAGDDAGALVITARHRQALADARAALGRCRVLAAGGGDLLDHAELFALELREALDVLGTLHGAVTTEDLLTRVFANFCIGK